MRPDSRVKARSSWRRQVLPPSSGSDLSLRLLHRACFAALASIAPHVAGDGGAAALVFAAEVSTFGAALAVLFAEYARGLGRDADAEAGAEASGEEARGAGVQARGLE